MSDGLTCVAHYARDLGASLDRMFENALDWEHLPFVHGGSFSAIRLIEQRRDGWRADVDLPGGGTLRLDLDLDRQAGCWMTDSYAGDMLIGRIVTHASATGPDSCRVAVEFLAPPVGSAQRDQLAAYYPALYASLYDEDENLMVARQAAVERGPEALAERRTVQLSSGEEAQLPLYCPHLGLPLDAEPDADGTITCPWHGYRFDIATGRCLSGAECGWRTDKPALRQ